MKERYIPHLLLGVAGVGPPIEEDEQSTISQGAQADRDGRPVDVDGPARRAAPARRRAVLGVLEDKLERDDGRKEVARRALALVQDALVLGGQRLGVEMRLGNRSADNREGRVRSLSRQALADQVVEPGRRDRVGLERLRLKQLDEVLHLRSCN